MKTLSAGSKQGVREFLTEIKTLSNVKHPNLVELIGFSIQGPSRTLVYEYVENGNLDSALLGKFDKSSWCELNPYYSDERMNTCNLSFLFLYFCRHKEHRHQTRLEKKICYLYRYC